MKKNPFVSDGLNYFFTRNKAVVLLFLLFIYSCDDPTNKTFERLINWEAPQHPFLASGERSNVHNDAYMTDSYSGKGPEGDNLKVSFFSTQQIFISIAFDSKGRIITLGTAFDGKRTAYLISPDSLKRIDSFELPAGNELTISGTGYFYLDDDDQMVVPTTNKHIYRLGVEGNPSKFVLKTDFDLSSLADPCHIVSVLPDWYGKLWFVTEEGLVGIIDKDGTFNTIALTHTEGDLQVQEKIDNSFAVDETGMVFIVSNYAIYGMESNGNKQPEIVWREAYDRGSVQKPGQLLQGSGTTPTLISDDYVAITDNADPRMNVLVYKRNRRVYGKRLLCQVPVFTENRSANENSLIAFSNSIIVENNYGYTKAVDFIGKFSEPGMARIDFKPDGSFETIWDVDETIPSVVSKIALGNKTVYTYTKEADGWYFTGLDADTGQKRFSTKAGGDELRYNNHYSGIAIAPDGSAYVGCLGGIICFSENKNQ